MEKRITKQFEWMNHIFLDIVFYVWCNQNQIQSTSTILFRESPFNSWKVIFKLQKNHNDNNLFTDSLYIDNSLVVKKYSK